MPVKSGTLLVVLTIALDFAGAQAPGKEWKKLATKPAILSVKHQLQGFFGNFQRPIHDGKFEAYGRNFVVTDKGLTIDGGPPEKFRKNHGVFALPESGTKRAILLTSYAESRTWSPHWGLRFKIDGKQYHVIDANADGNLGDHHQDALVRPNSWIVSPWNGEVWTENGGWLLRLGANKESWWACKIPNEAPVKAKTAAAWRYFQTWRQAAGCPSVAWNQALADACLAHCHYYDINRTYGHFEVKGKRGYSDAGHAAARASVLGYAKPDAMTGILEQFRTAYHLQCMLRPGLQESALACSGGCFVGHVGNYDGSGLHRGPVKYVWPPHGATNVFKLFSPAGENPMPVPGREKDYRLPIGQVVFAKVRGPGPFALDVRSGKNVIEGYFTCPGQGIKGRPANRNLVMLAPKRPLPSKAWIDVTLTLGAGDERTVRRWRFKTK